MISNIQALRAFAALNVVFSHVIGNAEYYGQEVQYFAFLEGWGHNGVDIFFVISGFVMVYTQSLNPKSPIMFVKSRLTRIVPIYWLLTLFMIALLLIAPSVFRQTVFSLELSVSSFLFVAGLFMDRPPVVVVGWTLEYEMLFYALFALGLFLKSNVCTILMPAAVLLSFAFLGYSDWIVIEFIFGMACAQIFIKYPKLESSGYLLALGVFLLVLSAFFSLTAHRVIVWGLPSAMIVLAVCYLPQTKNKILMLLGDSSYSIYLIQVLSVSAFYKVSSNLLPGVQSDVLAIVCLAYSGLIGVFMYWILEKPTIGFIKRFGSRAPVSG